MKGLKILNQISRVNASKYMLPLVVGLLLNGCSKEEVKVDCSQVFINVSTNITDAECGLAEGEIIVETAPDASVSQYRLDDGPFQSVNTFDNLKPGKYLVTVENTDGCQTSVNALIRSGVSYSASVLPIFEQSCIIPACHDGSGNIDFRVFSNLNPSDIKGRTQSGNMPKNGTLTEAEIETIACWVNDGALNN